MTKIHMSEVWKMLRQRGFSYSAVQDGALKLRLGIKPKCHVSDKLSDEDIDRARREASIKVFGDKAKND